MRSSVIKPVVIAALSGSLLLLGACGKDDPKPAQTASPAPSASASVTPSASASPTPSTKPVKPSSNFDDVKVTGAFGKSPKVTIKDPWAIDKTRAKVLEANDSGPTIKEGQPVEMNYAGYNARTGKLFDESFARGQTATFDLNQVVPGFKKGLLGQHMGSRVVVAMPGPDGYDASGGQPDIGVLVGDTLVFVVDVVAVPLEGPSGAKVTPKAGLPTVTEAGGKPQITVPKTDPPKELQAQTLIEGKGKKVTEADSLTLNYLWVNFSDGKLLEQTYGAKPAASPLSSLLPGMVKGLVGKTVGSRVLLVIPPSEGYPKGNATPSIAPDQTTTMVVDILFASQPPPGQ